MGTRAELVTVALLVMLRAGAAARFPVSKLEREGGRRVHVPSFTALYLLLKILPIDSFALLFNL